MYSSDLIFKRVNKKLNDIRVRLVKKVRESKGTYDSYKDDTKAQNYIKEQSAEEINLIINNNNVTTRLKHDVLIKEDTNIGITMKTYTATLVAKAS